MAATIRASTAPSAVLNPTSPASTQVGDLVIVITATVAGAGVPTHTLSGGGSTYKQIISHSHDDGSTDGRVSIACIVATSPGAVAYQAYTVSGGTSNHSAIVVITAGTFESSLVNVTSWLAASITGTTNAAPDPPAITPTRSGALVMLVGFWHFGSTATACTVTEPANYATVTSYAASATCELSVSQRTASPTVNVSENPATYVDNATPNGTVAITLAIYPRALSLAADARSYAFTGNAAGLTKTSKLVADNGDFDLVGNDAGLTQSSPKSIVADTGAFALTGNAAIKKVGMPAATGAIALNGNVAGLGKTSKLVADTQSYALAGNVTNLRSQRKVVSDTQSYALAGNVTTLKKASMLAAAAAAFALLGNAVNFDVKMPASTGSFAINGFDAGLVYTPTSGYPFPVDSGSFALTGRDASLKKTGTVMIAALGSFALVGSLANLRAQRFVTVSAGTFVINTSANFVAQRKLVANTTSFALAGGAVNLSSGKGMSAASRSFAFVGYDVGLHATHRMSVSTGAIVLTGSDVRMGRSYAMNASTVDFDLIGIDALFSRTRVLVASTGDFALEGSFGGWAAHRMLANTAVFVWSGSSAGLHRASPPIPAFIHIGPVKALVTMNRPRAVPLVTFLHERVVPLVTMSVRVYPEDAAMGLKVGSVAVIPVTIRRLGVKANPDTLTLTVRDPDGTATTYTYGEDPEIEHVLDANLDPKVGEFQAKIAMTKAKTWRFIWTTTSPDGVEDGTIDVQALVF